MLELLKSILVRLLVSNNTASVVPIAVKAVYRYK